MLKRIISHVYTEVDESHSFYNQKARAFGKAQQSAEYSKF